MDNRLVVVDGVDVSRETLETSSLKLAHALHELGLRPGETVGVLLHNQRAYLEIILACRRLGAFYTPINWHFTAPEVEHIMRDSAAKALFTQSSLLDVAKAACPAGVPIICTDAAKTQPDVIDYTTWIADFVPWDGPQVPPRGHMAYTSGTTGRPKGVVREPTPVEDLSAQQKNLAHILDLAYGLRPGCRALLPAPIYHSAPSLFCQVSLQICSTFVVLDRFDPEKVLEAIERYQIEVAYMVPIMFIRLLRLAPEIRDRYDVSSLRYIASTGAPCPADVKADIHAWLGPVIHETYASSESGLVTLATPQDAADKPGTAGKALPGATIRILDEQGRECAPNENGLIYVRNTNYADFIYRNQPEARAAIDHDGLITLGDMGYLDEEGYLFVNDRKADMVLSGGVNIYPAEIEHAMAGFPGLEDCGVIGVPDPEFGQKLIGVLLPQPGQTIDTNKLHSWLESRIARFKIPRTFVITEELPRDANGKLARHKLRQAFLDTNASQSQ